jgi:hypothetical protein
VGAVLALLCACAPAHAGFAPGDPPSLCSGPAFADQIGTAKRDRLQAATRPERLWGLGGHDLLLGSPTRATCLFGGDGGDRLALGAGGGIAFGETGADTLAGGPLDDVLRGGDGDDAIAAAGGADTIDGGEGRDAIAAGDGDDLIDAADGAAELIDCGDGEDLVAADRLDALIGCESPALAGPAAQRPASGARTAGRADIVRLRFRAPATARAGAYRVILLESPGCVTPGAEVARIGAAVNRGRRIRIGLRPPAGGWCAGAHRAAVVLRRPPATPEPVARLDFRIR